MQAYIYQAALLCEDCANKVMARLTPATAESQHYDSDKYPIGPVGDGGGEADSPQHCDHCRLFLENPLTRDGVKYVVEAVCNADPRNDVVREWAAFYGPDYPECEFAQLA